MVSYSDWYDRRAKVTMFPPSMRDEIAYTRADNEKELLTVLNKEVSLYVKMMTELRTLPGIGKTRSYEMLRGLWANTWHETHRTLLENPEFFLGKESYLRTIDRDLAKTYPAQFKKVGKIHPIYTRPVINTLREWIASWDDN